MIAYRVRQVVEPSGVKYDVQRKFLFFWVSMLMFDYAFDTLAQAQNYIKNLQEKHGKIID